MIYLFFIAAVLFLAFGNGANDNFKGMATVYGSRLLSYRKSLFAANLSTVAGALAAFFFARELIEIFSGKGFIPSEILSNPNFGVGFALGSSLTIYIATRLSYPVSTTHALLGALAGAGFYHLGSEMQFYAIYHKAVPPLILSPLIAMALTFVLYNSLKLIKNFRRKMPDCICEVEAIPVAGQFSVDATPMRERFLCKTQELAETPGSVERTERRLDFDDYLHVFSGCVVCFARGVNDAPKIASLLMLSAVFSQNVFYSLVLVGASMLMGGVLFSKKVAHTVSHKITGMDHQQGLAANLATGLLVLFASKAGMPVSTTHVSVGSLIGVGLISQKAKYKKILEVLLAWVITLPMAFIIAFVASMIID